MTESDLEFKFTNQCAFEGCKEKATTLACGRDIAGHSTPAKYCNDHAKIVVNEDGPEYRVECPNCHCNFGVN